MNYHVPHGYHACSVALNDSLVHHDDQQKLVTIVLIGT